MQILYIIFMMTVIVGLQRYIYEKRWDKNLRMKISFSAKEAFEGETLSLTEELTNAKLLPMPWVTARFQVSRNLHFKRQQNISITDDHYQNDVFSIMMYQSIKRSLPFVCGKRGYYVIKSLNLVSGDIFMSKTLAKELECDAELTVFPKLIPIDELTLRLQDLYGDIMVQRFSNPDPFAFKGIRDYNSHDNLRSINFKATAKNNRLMVNVNSPTASQQVCVIFNTAPYCHDPLEIVLEEGIRLAASVVSHYIQQGFSVAVLSNGQDQISGNSINVLPGNGNMHFYNILEQLSRIDANAAVTPISRMMGDIYAPEPVYIIISAYDGTDVSESFEELRSRGLNAYWIIPTLPQTLLRVNEGDGIMRWEVTEHDAYTYQDKKSAG